MERLVKSLPMQQFLIILTLGCMGLFFIWNGYLTFHNRNKERTDSTTGLRTCGNTSRKNAEGIASIICGSFLVLLIFYFYLIN